MPKTLKVLPKWRNFAKSGHTGPIEVQSVIEQDVQINADVAVLMGHDAFVNANLKRWSLVSAHMLSVVFVILQNNRDSS